MHFIDVKFWPRRIKKTIYKNILRTKILCIIQEKGTEMPFFHIYKRIYKRISRKAL
jgi:hypothetical protein